MVVCSCDPRYAGGIGKRIAVWDQPGKKARLYLKYNQKQNRAGDMVKERKEGR
jgi:hypothetical protein